MATPNTPSTSAPESREPVIARIDRKALRTRLEPLFQSAIGANPLDETVDFIAASLEQSVTDTVIKELTASRITKLHREWFKQKKG